MSDELHGARLDRVETEVATIRQDMGGIIREVGGLKSDVRGLGSVLERIEQGVAQAQQRFDDREQAAKINPVALATVLLSIISILVGGAWLISGQLSTLGERSVWIQRQIDRNEQRLWTGRKGGRDVVEVEAR